MTKLSGTSVIISLNGCEFRIKLCLSKQPLQWFSKLPIKIKKKKKHIHFTVGEKLTWLLLMKLQMRHLTTTLTGTPQWKCYGSVSGLPRGLSPMHQDIFRSDCFRCCKESQKGCAEPLTNGSVEEESPLSSGCRRRRQGPCAKPQRHHPPSVQTEGARTWMQVCKACSLSRSFQVAVMCILCMKIYIF